MLVPGPGRSYHLSMAQRAGRVRVLIVEDHRMVAESLQAAMERERGVRVVGVAGTVEAAESLAAETSPGVALVDLEMPGDAGIESIRSIRRAAPDARVLALVGEGSDLTLGRALEAGAVGYVSTFESVARLRESIVGAARGDQLLSREEANRLLRHLRHRRAERATARQRADRLTTRELEILQAMADGGPPKQVASALGIAPATLRTHLQNILTKLDVRSRAEALAFAIRHGKITARP